MLSTRNAELNLSAPIASWMMLISVPRNLPGISIFLVFGTTKVFRARLYHAFWPKRWQRHDARDTPLATPYQNAQTGANFFSPTPRIDVTFTTASLRWDHGDQVFAGWESRMFTPPHTDKAHLQPDTDRLALSPTPSSLADTLVSPGNTNFASLDAELGGGLSLRPVEDRGRLDLHRLASHSEDQEECKGTTVTFDVASPLPTRKASNQSIDHHGF